MLINFTIDMVYLNGYSYKDNKKNIVIEQTGVIEIFRPQNY
jgi:hypothetical protein